MRVAWMRDGFVFVPVRSKVLGRKDGDEWYREGDGV